MFVWEFAFGGGEARVNGMTTRSTCHRCHLCSINGERGGTWTRRTEDEKKKKKRRKGLVFRRSLRNGNVERCPEKSEDASFADASSTTSSRREVLRAALVGTGAAGTAFFDLFGGMTARAELGPESNWPLWLALPIAPYGRKKTIKRQVGPGIWIFDQSIAIYYVTVPIRMTVVAMEGGGLFVYAPIAPTKECLHLLQPLIDAFGKVKYIVLPSVAVEHKVNAGPFARKFPDAEFYVTDKQYSFPINLPSSFLGFPPWTKPLPTSSRDMTTSSSSSQAKTVPWDGEFEHEVLRVKPGVGSDYQDAAFYHKPSKTVLVCDALYSTTEDPPAILTSDPEYVRALLFHARDSPEEVPLDTPENRRKGWRRIIMYANYFIPGAATADLGPGPILTALKQLDYPLGWGGWLPFQWRDAGTELRAFKQFSAEGKPQMLPIIQIILARGPEALEEWLNRIKSWDFNKVIPAHLDAPLEMGPTEFAATFEQAFGEGKNKVRSCDEDVEFLRKAEEGPLKFSVYASPLGTLRGASGCNLRA